MTEKITGQTNPVSHRALCFRRAWPCVGCCHGAEEAIGLSRLAIRRYTGTPSKGIRHNRHEGFFRNESNPKAPVHKRHWNRLEGDPFINIFRSLFLESIPKTESILDFPPHRLIDGSGQGITESPNRGTTSRSTPAANPTPCCADSFPETAGLRTRMKRSHFPDESSTRWRSSNRENSRHKNRRNRPRPERSRSTGYSISNGKERYDVWATTATRG